MRGPYMRHRARGLSHRLFHDVIMGTLVEEQMAVP